MERLIGKEIAMYELDNEMVNLGFMSEGECIGQREVVESECVSYTKDGEEYTVVDFEIVSWNEEEEGVECTLVRIINIR